MHENTPLPKHTQTGLHLTYLTWTTKPRREPMRLSVTRDLRIYTSQMRDPPPRQKKLKKIRLESKEGGRLQGGE
jgi:hypothetical protein